jgi:hypothetical protein
VKGLKELIELYRQTIIYQWNGPFRSDPFVPAPKNTYQVDGNEKGSSTTALSDCQHALWMLDEMDKMLADPRMARLGDQELLMKFHRWLGFVQGVLWVHCIFNLDELREDTRKATHAS